MSYVAGEIEIDDSDLDDMIEVRYWRDRRESEIYVFEITDYEKQEITPMIQKEPETDLVEKIEYTEDILRYFEFEEFDGREETGAEIFEQASIPNNVVGKLEEEGYNVNLR